MATVVHGVRTAVAAGCRVVVLTNAAGGIRAGYRVGQPVLIADHLNLTGRSPLAGPPPPEGYASRFTDLTDLYSARLRALARRADPDLAEGVYAAMPGPHYETPAEIRCPRHPGRRPGRDVHGPRGHRRPAPRRRGPGDLPGQQPGGGAGRPAGSTIWRWWPRAARRPAGWAPCWPVCCPASCRPARTGHLDRRQPDRRQPDGPGRTMAGRRPGRTGPRPGPRAARRRRRGGQGRPGRPVPRPPGVRHRGAARRRRRGAEPDEPGGGPRHHRGAGQVAARRARRARRGAGRCGHRLRRPAPVRGLRRRGRPGAGRGGDPGAPAAPAEPDPAAGLRDQAPGRRGRDHDHGQPQPARRQRVQALPRRRGADHPAGRRANRARRSGPWARCPRSRWPPRTAR